MTNLFQSVEKAKTIAEHINIILKYQQTGIFDRDRAREICKRFNVENPEYSSAISAAAIAQLIILLQLIQLQIMF